MLTERGARPQFREIQRIHYNNGFAHQGFLHL